MLTLDLTSSRNLCDALPGSRSRAGLVAAVITEKDAPSAISTDVKKLWKAKLSIPLYRFSELGVYPHRSFPFAPDSPVRWFKILGPLHRRYETARDCRCLTRTGQPKRPSSRAY